MSDEEELNADEMDALLRDLESRANASESKGSKKSKDVDDFLADPPKKKTKTKAKPAIPDLPKAAPKGEMEKVDTKSKPDKKEKPKKEKKEKAVKVVQRGTDDELQKKLGIALLVLVLPIALGAIWMLGTFLSPVVSAGWLIAINATCAVLAASLGLKVAIKKGKFIAWTGLVSAVLLAGMLAISPSLAGTRIIQYGHWPSTAVSQLTGWSADSFFTKLGVSISSGIGALFVPEIPPGGVDDGPKPRNLGTVDPMYPETVKPDPKPDTPPADVKPKEGTTPDPAPKEGTTPDPNPEGNPL